MFAKFQSRLQELLQEQQQRSYKRMWVYHQLRNEFAPLTMDQLNYIAAALGFHQRWTYYKLRDQVIGQKNTTSGLSNSLIKSIEFLELTWPATPPTIKDAFRRLSKTLHPDAGGSHEAFIELTEHYQNLLKYVKVS